MKEEITSNKNKDQKVSDMKKILLVTALVLAIGLSVSAQDGFFRGGDDGGGNRTDISGTTPALPQGGVGVRNDDQPAPLGGGLLVMTVLGGAYLLRRREA